MAHRSGMKPVYVGDVGEITLRPVRKPIPNDVDLDSLDIHELCAMALEAGVGLRDLIGINNCYDHVNMVLLGSNAMPQGFNIIEHTKYCRNCFQMFRLKRLPG